MWYLKIWLPPLISGWNHAIYIEGRLLAKTKVGENGASGKAAAIVPTSVEKKLSPTMFVATILK